MQAMMIICLISPYIPPVASTLALPHCPSRERRWRAPPTRPPLLLCHAPTTIRCGHIHACHLSRWELTNLESQDPALDTASHGTRAADREEAKALRATRYAQNTIFAHAYPVPNHTTTENNPEVMTSLMHNLGLSPTLQFHDVFSIDEPDLLAIIPRPAHALLLVFPVSDTYEKFRHEEDKDKTEYEGKGEDEEVIWYKQTIGNACGLIGLLHSTSNGAARAQISEGSDLDILVKKAVPLTPYERATLLEETEALAKAHAAAAQTGDTAAPGAEDNVDLHFVCFVKSERDGHLYEMDGRRKGPLDRGELGEGEDVLSEKALEKGIRAFLKREESAGGGELRFSLIALAEGFD